MYGPREIRSNCGDPAKKPQFDAVVANPPFSYRWEPGEAMGEDMRFKNHGVAAFGHSLGGAASLQAARDDSRIKAAIDIDGSRLSTRDFVLSQFPPFLPCGSARRRAMLLLSGTTTHGSTGRPIRIAGA